MIIFADDAGIHFEGSTREIIVHWGEIAAICAVKETSNEGEPFLEIYVDHMSGVDFRFHSVDEGYAQVLAEMEKHLIGFSRERLETVRTIEEMNYDIPAVWTRDENVQPFELHEEPIVRRDPTEAEAEQIVRARAAAIETCERILGRTLTEAERAFVHVDFKNGKIVGNIYGLLAELVKHSSPAPPDPS
jgi:hypothetical protein